MHQINQVNLEQKNESKWIMIHVERTTLIVKLLKNTSMLRSSLFDYSDAYIIVKGAVLIQRVAAPKAADNDGKEVAFKNCASFTSCVSEINNTQIDNANNID